MTIRLIVNADDYGRSPAVSAGIRHVHQHGLVTSTTAMMNRSGIQDDLDLAIHTCPHLGLGVHLVLTSGVPLSPLSQVKSLITKTGCFYALDEFISRLGQIDLQDVKLEWQTQINKFHQITGKYPDHLDSHHHASYFTPDLFRLMLAFARECSCPIRLPVENSRESVLGELNAVQAQVMEKAFHKLINEFTPLAPDFFIDSFYDQGATLPHLLTLLDTLPEGTTELMCHPGFLDEEMLGHAAYSKQRSFEATILCDLTVREKIDHKSIELAAFNTLG